MISIIYKGFEYICKLEITDTAYCLLIDLTCGRRELALRGKTLKEARDEISKFEHLLDQLKRKPYVDPALRKEIRVKPKLTLVK